jgi:glycopeptide antibiotics resistance protein
MVPGFLFYLGYENKRYRLFPFLVLLAYAAGVELLQGFVPYRSFDWLDLLTNMVGISMFQSARIFNKST